MADSCSEGEGTHVDVPKAIWASLRDKPNDDVIGVRAETAEEQEDKDSFEALLRANTDESLLRTNLIG